MVGHQREVSGWPPDGTLPCPQSGTLRSHKPPTTMILQPFCLARTMLRYIAPARLKRGACHATCSSLHRGRSAHADPRRTRGVGGRRTAGSPPGRRASDGRRATIGGIPCTLGCPTSRPALPAGTPRARIGSTGAASLRGRRAAAITPRSWDGPTHDVRATRHGPTARPRHGRSWRWRGAARRRTRGWPRRAPIAAPGRRRGRGTERFGPRGPQGTESPPTG